MPGTKEGGRKTAATLKKKYGVDYYAKVGSLGGQNGRTGGFFDNRSLASQAGAKGGSSPKRGKAYQHLKTLSVGDTIVINKYEANSYRNSAYSLRLKVSIINVNGNHVLTRLA